jgi:hypothetical protein
MEREYYAFLESECCNSLVEEEADGSKSVKGTADSK